MNITTLSILERIAEADDLLSCVVSKSEFRIFKELEASDYIVGQIGPVTHDSPETMIENVGFSTEGRLLMESLKKLKKEGSFWAVTWRWLGPALGWIAGIASAVLGPYLSGLLTPK